jgi:hypothetical protein
MKAPHEQIQRLMNMQMQQQRRQEVYEELGHGGGGGGGDGMSGGSVSESEMSAVCEALEDQRQGLQILTEILM